MLYTAAAVARCDSNLGPLTTVRRANLHSASETNTYHSAKRSSQNLRTKRISRGTKYQLFSYAKCSLHVTVLPQYYCISFNAKKSKCSAVFPRSKRFLYARLSKCVFYVDGKPVEFVQSCPHLIGHLLYYSHKLDVQRINIKWRAWL